LEPFEAIDIGRAAILEMLLVGAPVLLAGMLVGLLVGLLQALTQVQEQTIAFVPKIIAMLLAVSLTLPWLMTRMIEYAQQLYQSIPDNL